MGLESNSLSDLVFINFIVSKFDLIDKQRWELSLEGGDIIPDLDMLHHFLEKEVMGMTHNKNDGKQFR